MAEKPCTLVKNSGGVLPDINFKLVKSGSFNSINGTVTIDTSVDLKDKMIIVRLDNSNMDDIFSVAIGHAMMTNGGDLGSGVTPGLNNISGTNFYFKWDNVFAWNYYIYSLFE